ncbi:MAG: ribosome assembly cofactor RimP [Putridiphycobacter sp.]
MISKQVVEKLATERIEERNLDVYIVDIKISSSNQIIVELDSMSGGVSIDDCVAVSRNIEHNLDREVQDFSLEVASAGLDKPFKVFKQYQKNVGKTIQVKTNDIGKTEGVLKSVNETELVVTTKEKKRIEGRKKKEWVEEDVTIPMNEIKETKLVITF